MEKTPRPNRIREALGQLHEEQPAFFREYLRRFQEDPSSRVFAPLAEGYRRLGRFDEAITICEEGLEHHPDFHGGRVVLAKCYLAKSMWNEARNELGRVVHAVPENLLAQRLLGDTYLSLGNQGDALHCYKMALLLAPSDVALAQKVHELEEGAPTVFLERSHGAPNPSLPGFPGEPEEDIPPFWSVDESENGADQRGQAADIVAGSLAQLPAMGLQPLLGDQDDPMDDDAFKVAPVSSIFDEESEAGRQGITTETLGDLYFSQGQFDKALRIFEKLRSTPVLVTKIHACRTRLGVDMGSLVRIRKIELLRGVLERAKVALSRGGA